MPTSAATWLSLSGRRRLPVIRQSTIAECGLACMAMIVAYFGRSDDLVSLRRRFGMSLSGASLASLARIGEALYLSPRAVRCRLSELRRLTTPCILHWEFDHFVVLKKVTRQQVLIHDPASGARRVSLAEADGKFTGVALEFLPTRRFERSKASKKLRLGDLVVF
ncbi:MAG: cysteine peptidase family C39 domain-containing protein, partial [Gammaproteobacteria bacterium]|nr:cysteine peptidase family C39 domain-containing protein [Gammaproteobacteria bacterium]